MFDYRLGFYAKGSKTPNDYAGFFPTREAAIAYGEREIARVATMPETERDCGMDWAVRYSIRKFKKL